MIPPGPLSRALFLNIELDLFYFIQVHKETIIPKLKLISNVLKISCKQPSIELKTSILTNGNSIAVRFDVDIKNFRDVEFLNAIDVHLVILHIKDHIRIITGI